VVSGKAGDTLRFQVQLQANLEPDRIASNLEPEVLPVAGWPSGFSLQPENPLPSRILSYTWVVRPGVEWIHLVCNGDIIAHYRIEQDPAPTIPALFSLGL